MLSPNSSSRMETRKGRKRASPFSIKKVVPPTQIRQLTTPTTCTPSWAMGLRPVPIASGLPNRATQRVPQIPAPRCTGTAPTASSMRYRNSRRVLINITTPPIAPITMAAVGVITWQQAVTDTKPAKQPLVIHSTATCRPRTMDRTRGNNSPPDPPKMVFSKIIATLSSKVRALPPLNPNQPNHRTNAPRMVRGKSLP